MKHIVNFFAGAFVIGGLVGVACVWVAVSIYLGRWMADGEAWGFLAGVTFALSGFGGVGFAVSEADKADAKS